MANVLTDQEQASVAWTLTKQAKTAVNQKIGELESCSPETLQDGAFQAVEDEMANLRLRSMMTFFCDIDLAQEKDVENVLWLTQTKINQVYRKVLMQLRKASKAHVLRHKVERRYLAFLKLSQQFYRAFIQRLASRYIIPDVEEVCKSLGLETLQEPERVDPVAANIHGNILKSCYNTLIHLGDLSRYRYQQSQKGLDSGVSYYRLAQKLNPDDGTAHHQMGVFYNEQNRHLDITYHFYRAAVCKKAHPNASMNLEVELKRALASNFIHRRGNGNTPQDVLKSWFVRLHANFRKGTRFPEYDELEKEVIHRVGMAWKSNEPVDMLLYIILVNFSAYHDARTRISGGWTMSKSLFCQFALRLIVRTTLSLSEVVYNEIAELADERSRLSPNGTKGRTETFPSGLARLLPLFRLSCAWLVYHHREVVKYEEHLQPYITEMYRMVAKAQTQFSNVFADRCPGVSEIATYLLPEDEEAVGLLALDSEDVFYALRFQYTRDNVRKPRGPNPKSDKNRIQENWWRVRDILNCGVFLVADPKFPLELIQVKGISEMVYSDDVPAVEAEAASSMEKPGAFGEALDLLNQTTESNTPASPFQPPTKSPHASSALLGVSSRPPSMNTSNMSPSQPKISVAYTEPSRQITTSSPLAMSATQLMAEPAPHRRIHHITSEDNDMTLEKEMVNMVDDLVANEAIEAHQNKPQNSYAVSPSTAALLNKLKSPDKSFPTLPWNYFLDNSKAQVFNPQPTQDNSSSNYGMDVYAQIYGGSSPAVNTPTTKLSVPGWTVQGTGKTFSQEQTIKSQPQIQSPIGSKPKAQSPGNKWGPAASTASNHDTSFLPQNQPGRWGGSSANFGTGSLSPPSQSAPASRTSQGDYDMLYQRLANMTTSARPAKDFVHNNSAGDMTNLPANSQSMAFNMYTSDVPGLIGHTPQRPSFGLGTPSAQPWFQAGQSQDMLSSPLTQRPQQTGYGTSNFPSSNSSFMGADMGMPSSVTDSKTHPHSFSNTSPGLSNSSQTTSIWASTPQTFNGKVNRPVIPHGNGLGASLQENAHGQRMTSVWGKGNIYGGVHPRNR